MLVADGTVAGKVVDLFAQTTDWQVRWLVVRRGCLLNRHQVLIAPRDITATDPGGRRVETSLSRDEVRAARAADSDRPASRRYLAMARRALIGPSLSWAELPALDPHLGLAPQWIASELDEESGGDLVSCAELRGYRLLARDAEVGRVADVVFEEWRLCSLAAEDGQRLVGADWISAIDWRTRAVRLMTPRLRLVSREPDRAVGDGLQASRGAPIL